MSIKGDPFAATASTASTDKYVTTEWWIGLSTNQSINQSVNATTLRINDIPNLECLHQSLQCHSTETEPTRLLAAKLAHYSYSSTFDLQQSRRSIYLSFPRRLVLDSSSSDFSKLPTKLAVVRAEDNQAMTAEKRPVESDN